ncbi:insulinase family protein [Candidatus Protochlamydia phocaeensis]|uniref:insulinase family protein n=1 Tax=Candidatus Protochlamydia phocaeensis TaxID=1414722 RepID=UPI000837B786|nr:insulinase family protein [Candidatus Protochlamydia phocaeensis]
MQRIVFFIFSLLALFTQRIDLTGQEEVALVEDRALLPLLTPTLADRQTLKLKLANGLQVYLISDPLATQSGAVLTVQAGSWDDPDDYPGLAHFLEHMLFLGTEKYPVESDYHAFIRSHNGKFNAYTSSDYTLYLFSIHHAGFKEALDRFSFFFKKPLFNPSGVARELQAIDQEFAKNFTNEGIRENAVQKELSNPEHPYHRFSTGNSLTLSAVSQQTLKKWYEEHYSANLMRLIVYSPLPLSALKQLVLEHFSDVPNRQLQPSRPAVPLLDPRRKASIAYIAPLADQRTLRLTWELPSDLDPHQIAKPEALVSYVLGHEGPGSLLAFLKAENLAENLGCSGYRLGSRHLLFSLCIHLTEEGLKNVDTILAHCFGAIDQLKSQDFPAYIFEEVKKMASMRYQYQSRENPFNYLMQMGGWLAQEELETFPERTLIPQAFDPSSLHRFLDALSPRNVHIHVLAKPDRLPIPLEQKERWMGVDYETRPIPAEQLTRLGQAKRHSQLYLPTPNPFIPQQLQLASLSTKQEKSGLSIPRPALLMDTEQGQLYFAKDAYFGLPQTVWSFEIQSPEIDQGNPLKAVLTDLYTKCLQEALNPFCYPAQIAGLEYEVKETRKGLLFTIKGYSDNAEQLFDAILQKLKACRPSEQLFHTLKQACLREYQNEGCQGSLQQGIKLFQSLIYERHSTHSQKVAALQELSYKQFLDYLEHLYDQAFIRSLFYGHVEKEQALRAWDKLHTALANSPFPKEQHPIERIIALPDQQGPFFIELAVNTPAHAAILGITTPDFSFKKRAAQQILSQAMTSAFYATLRTQQQTGYLVHNSAEIFDKHLFSFFSVQSHTHDPRDLLARFELFIESYLQEMAKSELTKEQFEKIRQALLTTIKQPPQSLMEMGDLLSTLTFVYEADFDWIEKRRQGFEDLTYDECIDMAQQFLGKHNKKRLAILVKGDIPAHKNFRYQPLKDTQEIRCMCHYTQPAE